MKEKLSGINYQKDSAGIVVLTLDLDGPVNMMNAQYCHEISDALSQLEAEENLSGVVITSAKATFFAGADLSAFASVRKEEEYQRFRVIEDAIKAPLRRLEKLQVPVVSAINGSALGGGLEICLACNYRLLINSNKALVGLPEVNLGLLPGGGGIVRAIHMLGVEKALPLLLEGKQLKPAQALKAGFVDELVENVDSLLDVAKAWIRNNPNRFVQPWDVKNHAIPGGDVNNAYVVQLLSNTRTLIKQKTRGLLPAPLRILDVVYDVISASFDIALTEESKGFAHLITTPQAKNIIASSFFQMNSIRGGISRPKNYPYSKIKKVGVIGAGMMGQGIAYASAVVGIEVVLKDIDLDVAEKGKAYSTTLFNKQIKHGLKSEIDKAKALDLIKTTDDYADLKGCDLIIEAVCENLALKTKITQDAEKYLSKDCIFGSNTSTLPITTLAKASGNPENFIGVHFFSPVNKMPLVEIICGNKTSEKTLAKAFDYACQIRKTAIVVRDSVGFFTSRVFGTYTDEGARLLVEGVDPLLIDAMGKSIGMPVGPLAVQDEVSQELTRKIAETHRYMGLYVSSVDNSYCTDLSEKMISKFGRGGRYHGGGYYEYPPDGEKFIWPKLYELFYKPELSMCENDIKERLLFRQVLESLKCLQEGVLCSVADGNIGSMLGIGAPLWTGGFIQFVNTYEYKEHTGLKAFTQRCHELNKLYGERFTVPTILLDKQNANETFV